MRQTSKAGYTSKQLAQLYTEFEDLHKERPCQEEYYLYPGTSREGNIKYLRERLQPTVE